MAILAVETSMPAGMDPMQDQIYRNQVASWNRHDDGEEYKTTEIEVEHGAPDAKTGKKGRVKVNLKFAMDGWYMFAVYGDNTHLHALDRDEWNSVAAHALEKYAGIHGLLVKLGPRPEDHNRYNFMVEFNKAIEMKKSTVELMAKRAAEDEERKQIQEARRRLGIDMPGGPSHYRPNGSNPFIA